MAWSRLPPLQPVAPQTLRITADARFVDLTRAARDYAHWALQYLYTQIRAVAPTAAVLRVEVLDGLPPRCRLRQVRDVAGELLWARGDCDRHPPRGAVAEAETGLAELLRWRMPQQLPGWTPTDSTHTVYQVDLHAVPPAVVLDPRWVAPEGEPDLAAVVGVLADVLNLWMPRVVWAIGEYARGLVQGYFPPLTDITGWAGVADALGHPQPTADTHDFVAEQVLDEEDWTIGIGSVHALAVGVLEDIDTGEAIGQEGPLHVRVGFYAEQLAAADLTLAQWAGLFEGDVQLTAAVLLKALAPQGPRFPR